MCETKPFLRALQMQGALRALAEPNLVAMNGQQASFLAGGEIPIPVVQGLGGGNAGGTVSVQYKEYGVRVNFKPLILDEEHIRLELEPEVSTLDYANSVRLNGFSIPALRTRRAKTGIELRDGQSFALAGLIDNNEVRSLSKIPYLGDIPVIGTLFNSKQFQKQETELVFFVTAAITRPINPDATPQLRGLDGLKTGSPLGDAAPAEEKRKKDVSLKNKAVTSPPAPAAVPAATPQPELNPNPPTESEPAPLPAPTPNASPVTRSSIRPRIASVAAPRTPDSLVWPLLLPDFDAIEKLVWNLWLPDFAEKPATEKPPASVRRTR